MIFKCLVVDDEPLARKLLISHLGKIEGIEVVGECGDAVQASNFLRNHPVDLILLDIQMPEINGFQFISTINKPPSIILTTAFREFAPEAFELNAVDYLLKPISFERLLKSINKFFEKKQSEKISTVQIHKEDSFILIKADRKIHKIAVDEIVYVESLDEYVKLHLLNKVIVSRENISSLAEKLTNLSFVRIHRSFIISPRFVQSVSSDGVEISGHILPFGRIYKYSALAALGIKAK